VLSGNNSPRGAALPPAHQGAAGGPTITTALPLLTLLVVAAALIPPRAPHSSCRLAGMRLDMPWDQNDQGAEV
jgi:hypothetical protein